MCRETIPLIENLHPPSIHDNVNVPKLVETFSAIYAVHQNSFGGNSPRSREMR
jgi:hypothetical protein